MAPSHASLTHILPALVLLRKPLSGLAKRQLPRTLCDIGFEEKI
jgi:hypothetical protein